MVVFIRIRVFILRLYSLIYHWDQMIGVIKFDFWLISVHNLASGNYKACIRIHRLFQKFLQIDLGLTLIEPLFEELWSLICWRNFSLNFLLLYTCFIIIPSGIFMGLKLISDILELRGHWHDCLLFWKQFCVQWLSLNIISFYRQSILWNCRQANFRLFKSSNIMALNERFSLIKSAQIKMFFNEFLLENKITELIEVNTFHKVISFNKVNKGLISDTGNASWTPGQIHSYLFKPKNLLLP